MQPIRPFPHQATCGTGDEGRSVGWKPASFVDDRRRLRPAERSCVVDAVGALPTAGINVARCPWT